MFLLIIISLFPFLIGGNDSPLIHQDESEETIRVMSYNIQHARGIDDIVDVDRIARVITDEKADVVALQEVDIGVERSGRIDLTKKISELTGLEYVVFGKNLDHQGGDYGNATLSRFPIVEHHNVHFEQKGPEKRGVLTTVIEIEGFTLLLLNTHLDHREGDDSERVAYISGARHQIIPRYESNGIIFTGDMNDVPESETYHKLTDFLTDAWETSGNDEGYTIPADNPTKRIDYIFYGGTLNPVKTWVPATLASDHLPVVSEFMINAESN